MALLHETLCSADQIRALGRAYLTFAPGGPQRVEEALNQGTAPADFARSIQETEGLLVFDGSLGGDVESLGRFLVGRGPSWLYSE